MTETVAQGGGLVAGRYRLVRALGAGGMGQVWYAHDTTLNRIVAVKQVQLPPSLSDVERRELVERAFREARNAARVSSHPNIVTVHDVVDDGGVPWIVMEYVQASDLARLVAEQGPTPPAEAARIGVAVLDALMAIHAAGILHRDIKPANILVTGDGQVLLTDFGIAVQEGDVTMTATGAVVATPEYMPPERANGQQATAASDLFSFAATIYELVEGVSPFRGESSVATFKAVLFDEPRTPLRAGPLAPLLYELLRKDPAQRPSAQQARQSLASLAAAAPGAAAPIPSTAPPTEAAAWPGPAFSPTGTPIVPHTYPPQPRGGSSGIRMLSAFGIQAAVVAVLAAVLSFGRFPVPIGFLQLTLSAVAVVVLICAIRSCAKARGTRMNLALAWLLALVIAVFDFLFTGRMTYLAVSGGSHVSGPFFVALMAALALIGAFSFVYTLAGLERRHQLPTYPGINEGSRW